MDLWGWETDPKARGALENALADVCLSRAKAEGVLSRSRRLRCLLSTFSFDRGISLRHLRSAIRLLLPLQSQFAALEEDC